MDAFSTDKETKRNHHNIYLSFIIFIEIISMYFLSLKNEPKYYSFLSPERNVILAVFREEGPYLKEWIDYHLNLGFNHFYLADNNFNDKDEPYLKEIRKLPYVEIADFRNRIMDQSYFVTHGYDQRPEAKNDWFLAIDIDEFFTLNGSISLSDYKKLVIDHGCSSIKINWLVYGNNGHLKKESGGVIERFPIPTNKDYMTTKPFSRGGIKATINVHNFVPQVNSFKCCNSLFQEWGCDLFQSLNYSYNYAYIRHYFTKSEEEWIEKQNKWFSNGLNNKRYRWKIYNLYNSDPPNVQHANISDIK